MSSSSPTYFPLRWESTGDQWWYASPIDYAAANGHYDLVRELLRLDGNHLIQLTSLRRVRRLETVWDDNSAIEFHNVAASRSLVARQLLNECEIKHGRNSLIGAGYGGWLLYTAASAGDLEFVMELLERDPLLVFGEGEYGVTDILYAAARSGSFEVFKVVFEFSECPRLEGQNGNFVPGGYKREILNRGLHAAGRGGNLEVLKELLKECLDDDGGLLGYRDVQGSTVLHAAAARGQVEVVKYLASSSEIVNSTDNLGNTPLHVAAHRGHLAVVEALILASPSLVNVTNNAGEIFLHAVVTGFQTAGFRRLDRQIELLKHLLSGKLFNIEDIINAQNSHGRTPLHLAIIGNIHSDLVELLMTIPYIDVNLRDTDGMTPLDILKKQPHSASSEILTRQLMSAGGTLSSQDYSTRRIIASHMKRQSIGNSPGTSFRISDVEILLHTGLENIASDGTRSASFGACSPEKNSQNDSTASAAPTPRKVNKLGSINDALKRFLHWPKMKRMALDGNCGTAAVDVAVPLRQRFSNASSLPNNKRAFAVRSNLPSPTAKKKLASGVTHDVMEEVPNTVRRRSRSTSFSKLSFSSFSSLGGNENEIAKASCSSTNVYDDNGVKSSVSRNGLVKKLCFGDSAQRGETHTGDLQPYDVYEQSVLSAA